MSAARLVRPTPRGRALGGVGGLVLVTGWLIGVRLMVQVGALLVLAVVAGMVWLALEAGSQERGRLLLTRRVVPHPVTAGDRAVVQVEVASSGGPHRLDRLTVAERAARELSGPAPLRARVHRSASQLTLTYPIRPERRGRWPVGPLEVQRRDLFGLCWWRGPLGGPMLVAVRPAVVPLSLTNRAASTDIDRAALGARAPAADDSSLRDYRTGDDLRRVHWRSSARRGELMVRQDERAGRRPASVLLDLPPDDASVEWSITVGASIALALVAAGHHVRLLAGEPSDAAAEHHRPDRDGSTADALLDRAVDLVAAPSPSTQNAWLRSAVQTLSGQAGGAELVFAVVGPLDVAELEALARVGAASHGWAMVRTTADGAHAAAHARTLESLRRAGWTACAVQVGEPVPVCWDRLLGSDERWVMLR